MYDDKRATTLPQSQQLLGDSIEIKGVIDQLERVAPTDASVLIIGESGSGKELVARSIHERSSRHAQPFIAINCGAIAATLIEAEFFGHEKGSFTGAIRSHAGVFERAHGGTLFLDEITEMNGELQVRLLRVLETGRFFRIGGAQEIAVDVRFIAATNRSPLLALRDGKLREDLLYRLAVFPIELPPLRARGDDVLLLARQFLSALNAQGDSVKRFSEASLETLLRHEWPGNVRELRNAIERAYILADEQVDIMPLMPASWDSNPPASIGGDLRIAVGSKLEEAERSLIEATLQHFEGNKKQAAEVLGCSLKTLYNKLNGYGREASVAQG